MIALLGLKPWEDARVDSSPGATRHSKLSWATQSRLPCPARCACRRRHRCAPGAQPVRAQRPRPKRVWGDLPPRSPLRRLGLWLLPRGSGSDGSAPESGTGDEVPSDGATAGGGSVRGHLGARLGPGAVRRRLDRAPGGCRRAGAGKLRRRRIRDHDRALAGSRRGRRGERRNRPAAIQRGRQRRRTAARREHSAMLGALALQLELRRQLRLARSGRRTKSPRPCFRRSGGRPPHGRTGGTRLAPESMRAMVLERQREALRPAELPEPRPGAGPGPDLGSRMRGLSHRPAHRRRGPGEAEAAAGDGAPDRRHGGQGGGGGGAL